MILKSIQGLMWRSDYENILTLSESQKSLTNILELEYETGNPQGLQQLYIFIPTKTFVPGAYGDGISSAVLNCLKKIIKQKQIHCN